MFKLSNLLAPVRVSFNLSLSLSQRTPAKNNKIPKNENNSFRIKSLNDGRGGMTKQFKFKPPQDNKKFLIKGSSDAYMHGLRESEAEIDPEKYFEVEEDLDVYSQNQHLYHKKIIDEDIRKRSSIKLAIINKKMRKLEGEKHSYFNLLTWDAKEQIKYLHLQDPEFWTVERIAQSYPITEENAHKLLKSKWSPKTLNDLAKHDQKVMQNWALLAKSEQVEARGPAINTYEEYKKSNKLALLKYACGLPDVEFKRSCQIFNDSFTIHESILCVSFYQM